MILAGSVVASCHIQHCNFGYDQTSERKTEGQVSSKKKHQLPSGEESGILSGLDQTAHAIKMELTSLREQVVYHFITTVWSLCS